MALSPSDFPVPAAPGRQQTSRRGRVLVRLSGVTAIAAVVIGLAWGPVMAAIARLLRPAQLNSGHFSYAEVAPLQHDAEQRMWIILIASFLVILALLALAIILGRVALRLVGNDVAVARLRRWGGICLAISLLSLVASILVELLPSILRPALFYAFIYTINQFLVFILIATSVTGATASFILNGMVVRKAPTWAWVRAGVSALLILLWFWLVAVTSQFIVAFYLHLVY